MMGVEVGKTYYFWCHAYLRLVGRVEGIVGQRRVVLSDASKILVDDRTNGGDEDFFRVGVDHTQTRTAYMGTVADVVYIAAVDYPFALPKRKEG